MSGHFAARSHLSRFGIVEGAICICLKAYETVDHLLWYCERFGAERRRLTDAFTVLTYCTNIHTGCAAWDSCPGFVCSEKVAGDELMSGFPRKSWNFKDSWSDIPSELK
jgi:hypothetical protein